MKTMRIIILGLFALAALAGCSQDEALVTPATDDAEITYVPNKNGTETLGTPSIAISAGSGFVEGGTGMVDVASGTLDIDVPVGSTINQVIAYWSGGTTGAPGDDNVMIDGNPVQGELIGGPVDFFVAGNGAHYHFSSYRADITDMGLVNAGANSLTITDFDFDITGGLLDEDNGISLVVIYDDGTEADLAILDGLDMAFFRFAPTLDATVPQTFNFTAEGADRMADLLILAGSVGEGRPNQIKVTTSAGDQMFTDMLGSEDALLWDSLMLPVLVPAGDTSLTVQLVSTDSSDPLGASLSWVTAGLSVPRTPAPELASLGDYVWVDANNDGIQDADEDGYPGALVQLMDCLGNVLGETMTDDNGYYYFTDLEPGDYMVHFVLPADYQFSPQDIGADDEADSDADQVTGNTGCVTLAAGENNLSLDAGLYLNVSAGCTYTIGYWKTHAGFGPQADVLTPLLPLWLGTPGGTESIEVTTAGQAVELLSGRDCGGRRNGIGKLYSQMLASKLNIAHGADSGAVTSEVSEADEFLAMYGCSDWFDLSRSDRAMVLAWKDHFDSYNNGLVGPGHCDDGIDEDCERGNRRDHRDRHNKCDRDDHCKRDRDHRGDCNTRGGRR